MKYRKRPVTIEAIRFTKNNINEIIKFVGYKADFNAEITTIDRKMEFTIHTLEGDMVATEGDYIIKGIQGEFYPCKSNIFEQTYELVEEN